MKGEKMNSYLIQLSYTPEAWAAMLKEPQNRIEKVSGAVKIHIHVIAQNKATKNLNLNNKN